MDSRNANAANETASGGHLGYEESSALCEHTVIVISVLMTLNMVALMFCYRMLILGKIRQILDRLVPPSERQARQVMVTAASEVAVQGNRSHRHSTDSSYYPPLSNLGPSTVVINNIGLYGAEVAKNPTATAADTRVEEKRVVMIQNPVVSTTDDSPSNNVGGEAVQSEDRKRKTSVFMDRPLPALPEENEERKMKIDDGLERSVPERRVKKSSTGSAVSYLQKDEEVSSSSPEVKRPATETGETDIKHGLFIDIELFI